MNISPKKVVIGLTVLGILIFNFYFLISSLFDQLACEGQLMNNNVSPSAAQQILGKHGIGQSFVAPRPQLYRLDLFFETYHRPNNHDIILQLLEISPNGKDAVTNTNKFKTIFNADSVQNKTWRSFTFPPIEKSDGKSYLITLQSPESKDGNAITVGGIEQNVYLLGTAFLGDIPIPADMAFRSCYQMTFPQKLQVLAEQITRHRPTVWGNPIFYGSSLLVYGLLLFSLFWNLTQLVTP